MHSILSFLRELKLAYKIGSLPGVAAVGFILILASTFFLGRRSAQSLGLIEEGYAASLEMSWELQSMITAVHQQLRDGATFLDDGLLIGSDSIRDAFAARLIAAETNPVLDAADLADLSAHFERYYANARAVTARMIDGESGEGIFRAAAEMTSQFDSISAQLAANIERDRQAIQGGFDSAASAQSILTTTTFASALISLALLIALSMVILRDTTELAKRVLGAAQSMALVSEELAASAAQMEKGAEAQSSSSEETSSAMVEMASQIDSVAKSAQELATTVDETAAAIREMGASGVCRRRASRLISMCCAFSRCHFSAPSGFSIGRQLSVHCWRIAAAAG